MSAFRRYGAGEPVLMLTSDEVVSANGAVRNEWRRNAEVQAHVQPATDTEVSIHPEGRRADEGQLTIFVGWEVLIEYPTRCGFAIGDRVFRLREIQPWRGYQRLRCQLVPGVEVPA